MYGLSLAEFVHGLAQEKNKGNLLLCLIASPVGSSQFSATLVTAMQQAMEAGGHRIHLRGIGVEIKAGQPRLKQKGQKRFLCPDFQQ